MRRSTTAWEKPGATPTYRIGRTGARGRPRSAEQLEHIAGEAVDREPLGTRRWEPGEQPEQRFVQALRTGIGTPSDYRHQSGTKQSTPHGAYDFV